MTSLAEIEDLAVAPAQAAACTQCGTSGYGALRTTPILQTIARLRDLPTSRCTDTRSSRVHAALHSAVAVVLAAIWIPLNASAQVLPDLAVESLSIHATMPDAIGERQVTASFRIVNLGTAPAAASLTSVQSASGASILATPALPRGSTAFFAITTTTSRTDFDITVAADVHKQLNESSETNNTASYRFVADQAAVGRWRPIGPSVIFNATGNPAGVGRITTIAVDPFSTSTLYVGSRGTGLWKTTDGGLHWEPLTDAVPTTNVNAVAVDPVNGARVFIASPAGIFGSADGGHVWTLLNRQDLMPQGVDGGAFIVHPFDPQRLYLSTRNGLRISRNGGVTWGSPVLGAGGIIESLVQDRFEPDHLLATVVNSPAAGVYETGDGGLTPGSWRKLQGCAEGPLPAIPQNAQAWVTQSGVTQWVSIKTGADHELWRTSSRACVINGRFERVWERLSAGTQTPCIGPNSEWSFLFADPTNSRLIYKGGVSLCRSTDGGASFQAVPGLVHHDHHALVFHPMAPSVLFLGNDGGLYRSDNGGQSWTFKAEGLQVTEFLDLDIGGGSPRAIVGGSQDNGLSSSDQTAPAWHEVNLGSDPDGDRTTAVVDPLNLDVQYSIGQAVDHFSRIQGGHRDEGFHIAGIPTGCLTYDEAGPNLFTQFIATSSPQWHLITTVGPPTTNGPLCNGGLWTGPPWRALAHPDNGEAFTRVTHDPANGLFLAGGNRGSVYINFSPDAMAKVWNAPEGSVTAIVRDLDSAGSYFVALSTTNNAGAGRIFEIHSDGPLHFTGRDITGNLPGTLVLTLAYNRFEPGVLYAGTQGRGVFRGMRNTAGQWTWSDFNNGMPEGAKVTKLRVNSAFGTIYGATYGRGAFVLDTVSNF